MHDLLAESFMMGQALLGCTAHILAADSVQDMLKEPVKQEVFEALNSIRTSSAVTVRILALLTRAATIVYHRAAA